MVYGYPGPGYAYEHLRCPEMLRLLGAYLAKTEQFQDKRKDASYADWFDALEAFNESTDNALDRPSPEPEDDTKKAN